MRYAHDARAFKLSKSLNELGNIMKIKNAMLFFGLLCSTGVMAGTICGIDDRIVDAGLIDMNEFYGDIPSPCNDKQVSQGHAVLCQNLQMVKIAMLTRMLNIYAEENATKRELTHKQPYWKSKFTTKEKICSQLKEEFEGSVGAAGHLGFLDVQEISENKPDGTSEGDCMFLLKGGMFNGLLENICEFNGGVKKSIMKSYDQANCRAIVSQEQVNSLSKEMLSEIRGDIERNGQDAFCENARSGYEHLIGQ